MSQSPAVAAAAEACPTRAIVQADGGWQIDDAACIRCNVCKELAPDDIAVEDRYADTIPLRTLVPADVARSG
jgi:Fe-S-cluster-containing hydrogenase component 2